MRRSPIPTPLPTPPSSPVELISPPPTPPGSPETRVKEISVPPPPPVAEVQPVVEDENSEENEFPSYEGFLSLKLVLSYFALLKRSRLIYECINLHVKQCKSMKSCM